MVDFLALELLEPVQAEIFHGEAGHYGPVGHRGAQPAVEFMVNAPRFRVRDIPGEIGDDVRLSLAERFVGIGFLRLAPARMPAQ